MTKYKINYTNKFNKDIKRCVKRNLEMKLLKNVILKLEKDGTLPQHFRPHKLSGTYQNLWECHIKPDWLLI